MDNKKGFFSVKVKIFIFVFLIVLAIAVSTLAVTFYSSADRINEYYRRCAYDNACNFASTLDGDYLARLRDAVETDEYLILRDRAEKNGNEELIRQYLGEKSLWGGYKTVQNAIELYMRNMTDIKYLYVIAQGDANAVKDMYLVDEPDRPLYQTGCYEEREKELLGKDLTDLKNPIINNGIWGSLCTAFSPVYSSDGECVCVVGCDCDMSDVVRERKSLIKKLAIGTALVTVLIQAAAVLLINKFIANPLKAMTTEMAKFKPSENLSYKDAGVMELDIRNRDEIGDLYRGIRSMQTNIIDHLNDLSALQQDKLRAEQAIRDKELRIGRLSKEAQNDTLTGVGSKSAYLSKVNQLNKAMSEGDVKFALVMVDMNNLKNINDNYGHKAGDQYIRGCCRIVCDVYKHSPVYRIGGDEFIVVLQGQDFEERQALIEELRERFEKRYNKSDLKPWFRYSAAVGMAENASYDTNADLVFKRADQSMYEDKKKFKSNYGI